MSFSRRVLLREWRFPAIPCESVYKKCILNTSDIIFILLQSHLWLLVWPSISHSTCAVRKHLYLSILSVNFFLLYIFIRLYWNFTQHTNYVPFLQCDLVTASRDSVRLPGASVGRTRLNDIREALKRSRRISSMKLNLRDGMWLSLFVFSRTQWLWLSWIVSSGFRLRSHSRPIPLSLLRVYRYWNVGSDCVKILWSRFIYASLAAAGYTAIKCYTVSHDIFW
jgi:hypothetical protein